MTAVLFYFGTAALGAWIVHRTVVRMRLWVAVILILLPLAFTGRALLTGQVYAPVDLAFGSEPLNWLKKDFGVERLHNGLLSDVYCLNIPWRFAVRQSYGDGVLALWNPSVWAGDILAASAQPTPYEPVFLLSLLIPMATSLTYLAAITFFILGLLMFAFLRDLGRDDLPALAGAATWMFTLFLVWWLEWVITATVMWLPLVLLGVRRVIRERSPGAAAILTGAFVMMLLNGHPESALHIVAVGLVWAGAEFWLVRWRGFVRATLLACGAGALALLLCAGYMLPVLEALPHTHEHFMRETFYAKIKKSSPLPRAMARLEAQLVPFIHGAPESEWPEGIPFDTPVESAYGGSAALALAAYGAWRSRARVKWMALALVVGGLIFGVEFPPFADLIGALPLFDIALNSRLIMAACLGLAILVSLGAEEILLGARRRGLAITAAVVAAILALASWNAWPRMQALGLSEAFIQTHVAILVGGALLVAAAASARGRVACALLLALIVAQRAIEDANLYPTLPVRQFYPPFELLKHFPRGGEPYRMVGAEMILVPNLATMYGLEDARGYQAMRLKRMKEVADQWSTQMGAWFNRVDDLTEPYLSAMNVRYALASMWVPIPPGWKVVAYQPGTNLLENTRVLPRAFVPRRVRKGLSRSLALEEIDKARDFGEISWIETGESEPHETPNGPGRLRVESYERNELAFRASMDGGGWVVISQAAWNGWRATLDGQRIPIRYANNALLGVYIPQGEHVLRLVYMPRGFVVGMWISAVTIAGLAIGIGRRVVQNAAERRRLGG